MSNDTTRRAVIAGTVLAGIGGLSTSSVRDLLEAFAPLSGRAWNAAGRELTERVESPYGEATVRVDEEGVPHVDAEGEASAYFAVGYLQAFDRLFQMDLQRRAMRGQLSEIVGEVTLESDEFHVAMDFAGAAEATWEVVRESEVGPLLEAYADGVTAAIERERLPVEFELLEYEPAPWTPVDTLLMEKQISWDLTGDFGELRRALVADRLGEDLTDDLYPERMDHDVPILRGETGGDGRVATGTDQPSPSVGAELTEWLSQFTSPTGVGSNSWVVSGDHTSSGNPVVANDPHLALVTPPLWYEQHVETPERSVRGVTFPGVPFVIIGANDRGAWGFTNVGADVLDCYTYEIDDDGERYRYRGEWREFETDERELEVADGENRDMTVRKSVHGPVLEREGRTVGVAWTGLTATRTTEAISEYGRSDGLEDVLEATERFDLPTQNLVYADVDGRTLYYVTGKLPIRTVDGEPAQGNRIFDGSAGDGEWEGFTPYGESSWEGFVPFEEKPGVVDPDVLATANQRVVDDPDHYLGVAYATPYRGARIYDRLDEAADAGEPMDPQFHRELQRDVVDERVRHLLPDLLEAVSDAEVEDRVAEAAETLEAWDRRMDGDSRGALVFSRWLEAFRREVLEPTFEEADLDSSYYPNDWVLATLPSDHDFFADGRAGAMVAALEAATAEIDEEGWETYGDRNTTGAIEHPLGGEAAFLNYDTLPADGSAATVNNYRFESAVGSSWRMVVEPGGGAWGILPGGNSGDYFSPHYDDQFDRWVDGEFKPIERTLEGELAVTFEEGSS